ncbi:MAG: DUF2971 domain-containing protein [Candidatus Delongbacteria bacterium]|jgi:hypothetical protein|nr:DUF2971 domain-containing protein [Candidatus Delongbacteria bacterium]
MKLYKFRPLGDKEHLKRIKDIINKGFYCCDFLEFNDMNEGVYIINPKNKNIDLSTKQKYKICSFSGINALNSQLMWGHYANTGMGVVIEIDVENCSEIKQVRYNDSSDNLNTIKEILTRKSKEWKYEDEYRYLTTKNISQEKAKVKIGKISKIYFGTPYKNLNNYEEIKEKHKSLKKYHKLQKQLRTFGSRNSIVFEDYEFKFK